MPEHRQTAQHGDQEIVLNAFCVADRGSAKAAQCVLLPDMPSKPKVAPAMLDSGSHEISPTKINSNLIAPKLSVGRVAALSDRHGHRDAL